MRTQLANELSELIDLADDSGDLPANDNDLGFHYVDLETDEAANDNGEYEEIDEDLFDDPRCYDFVEQPGRLERLLDEAGYDPAVIPPDVRRTAFEVALCFQSGIFDRDEVAETTHFSRADIRRATEALRLAAYAGTRVG